MTVGGVRAVAPKLLSGNLGSFQAGEQVTLRLQLSNAEVDEVRFEMMEGPDWVAVSEQGALKIMPPNSHRGEVQVRVRLQRRGRPDLNSDELLTFFVIGGVEGS